MAAFVVSLNLKRRHLNESQRAVVAAKLATLPKGANQHSPIGESSTQSDAAQLLNVGKRSAPWQPLSWRIFRTEATGASGQLAACFN